MVQQALLRVSLFMAVYTLLLSCGYKPTTQKQPEQTLKLNQKEGNFHQENGILFNSTTKGIWVLVIFSSTSFSSCFS